MIISQNRTPSLDAFKSLVSATTALLNNEAKSRTAYFLKRNAQLLEVDVYRALVSSAVNTKFQDTITVISGQRFPDIIAGNYYGVEVKSSKDEKWTSLGGSINESTRVEGVERIYLTFGKLVDPVEFRSRPYEDCLSEVVATHYPRYKIDMNLTAKDTIFHKLGMTYDELRLSDNPVGEIVKHYKNQLKEGESLWWIDNSGIAEGNVTASMKVRLWSSLSREEKLKLTTSLFALFPDMLSTENNKKYNKAVLWLASRHGIVDSSFRDKFSAGGKVSFNLPACYYQDLPKVFAHILKFAPEIRLLIGNTPVEILCETWGVSQINSDRISQWISLVAEKHQSTDYNSIEVLKSIFRIWRKDNNYV